jgi:hypothetical protein
MTAPDRAARECDTEWLRLAATALLNGWSANLIWRLRRQRGAPPVTFDANEARPA